MPTTIQVSEALADELYARKGRGETYEDVIWRLIDDKGESETRTRDTARAEPEAVSIDLPSTVDAEAAREAIAAAVAYIERERGATKGELVAEVMPGHALGYEVPDLDDGRYRGAWWRRVIKPGLEAEARVAKPKPGQSEWRWIG